MISTILGLFLLLQASSPDTTAGFESKGVTVLHDSLITDIDNILSLSQLDGWQFTTDDPLDSLNAALWTPFEISDGNSAVLDSLWDGFGWYRLQFEADSSFSLLNSVPVLTPMNQNLAIELYLNDELIYKVGTPSTTEEAEELIGNYVGFGDIIDLTPGKIYDLKVKRSFHKHGIYDLLVPFFDQEPYLFSVGLANMGHILAETEQLKSLTVTAATSVIIILLLCVLYLILYFRVKGQDENIWLVLLMFCIGVFALNVLTSSFTFESFWFKVTTQVFMAFCLGFSITLVPLVTHKLLKLKTHLIWYLYAIFGTLYYVYDTESSFIASLYVILGISVVGSLFAIYRARKKGIRDTLIPALSILGLPVILTLIIVFQLFEIDLVAVAPYFMLLLVFLTLPIGLSIYQARKFLRLHNEMDSLVEERTAELEQAYAKLEESLMNLKAAQQQLVQQEKLASLGQLTAGIAHEIKNPLNFVNNFSDVSIELVEEAREEVLAQKSDIKRETGDRGQGTENSPLSRGEGDPSADGEARGVLGNASNLSTILEILDDIKSNLRKIHEHGKRADTVVKSMLQHSRGGDGKPEPTNLNALVKEYVNLSFHGMRAGDDPINVDIELDLDESIGEVNLVAEDFSRVILNLCNNAFDAMREKQTLTGDGRPKTEEKSLRQPTEGSERSEQGDETESDYRPKLTVRTSSKPNAVTIEIEDNGPGIPDEIKDQILQPFFTTKKGTQGTGLGLSITNDIIKAHGGDLSVYSQPGQTRFEISLKND